MAGEITTLFGAILAIVDVIRMLTSAYVHRRVRGGAKFIPPVLLVLAIAVIILGLLGLTGVESLSVLP